MYLEDFFDEYSILLMNTLPSGWIHSHKNGALFEMGNSWRDLYHWVMIDGYNRKGKSILSKRRETEEKIAKEKVVESGIISII